jgi:hypothetical protein
MRVVLEETHGTTGPYITLSHRWTQPHTELARTLKTNYRKRRAGNGFGLLPKIFLDALHVARALDIEYVWIDSLCIVQDSNTDWKIEAGKMGDYYQQASFTIATTTWSPSGDEGLFALKPPRLARLPYRNQSGTREGSVYLYPDPGERGMALKYKDIIGNSELLSRGWFVLSSPSTYLYHGRQKPLTPDTGSSKNGSSAAESHASQKPVYFSNASALINPLSSSTVASTNSASATLATPSSPSSQLWNSTCPTMEFPCPGRRW